MLKGARNNWLDYGANDFMKKFVSIPINASQGEKVAGPLSLTLALHLFKKKATSCFSDGIIYSMTVGYPVPRFSCF